MKNFVKLISLSLFATFISFEVDAYNSVNLTTYSDTFGSTTTGWIGNDSIQLNTYSDSFGSSTIGSVGSTSISIYSYPW